MNESKFDLEKSNKVLERMNKNIEEIEKIILKDKTPEEQEKIKKQWEQDKIENEQRLKKEIEEFNQKWDNNNKNLISIDDMKAEINEMIKAQDEEFNSLLNSIIEELCKGKNQEEKKKIIEQFNNIINSDNTINITVSDMIPDYVYDKINKLDILELNLGEIYFFSKKNIDDAQKGFRYNAITNEIITDWIGNSYIIIGYDTTSGCGPDPLIIKISDINYPIYWLMTDGGDWSNPIKVADSLNSFIKSYNLLIEKKDVLKNNNKIDKEILLREVEGIINNSNIDWWKNLIMN